MERSEGDCSSAKPCEHVLHKFLKNALQNLLKPVVQKMLNKFFQKFLENVLHKCFITFVLCINKCAWHLRNQLSACGEWGTNAVNPDNISVAALDI